MRTTGRVVAEIVTEVVREGRDCESIYVLMTLNQLDMKTSYDDSKLGSVATCCARRRIRYSPGGMEVPLENFDGMVASMKPASGLNELRGR